MPRRSIRISEQIELADQGRLEELPAYVSSGVLCAALGISTRTAKEIGQRGELGAFLCGKQYRFSRDKIIELLEGHGSVLEKEAS